MIETLGTATLMAAVETADDDLQLTDIKFREGDHLCEPLYPKLFDYDRAPQGVRFEPGVRILTPVRQLQFQFQLFQPDEGAVVEFLVDNDGHPMVESVADPSGGPIHGLTAAVLLDPFTCRLTWDQPQEVEVTALRLRCKPIGRQPTDRERVDGGVYLAIINRPAEPVFGMGIGISDRGEPEQQTIKILGELDGRRVYDLFQPDALPSLPTDLSLEPTFRVRAREERVEFALRIAAPVDLRFVQADGDPQQVKIFSVPPPELDAPWLDHGDRCKLVWVPERSDSTGKVSAFYLEAHEEMTGARLRVDPTVIQPPSCSGGICI